MRKYRKYVAPYRLQEGVDDQDMKDPVKTALEADIRRLDATGRIRRSELQRLAWSCGDPDVALEDVEALLHSMDDITAEYLDDMPSDTDVLWFRQCLKLKRELRQSGMDSLSQCLQAPGGMDRLQMLAIWEALDPSQLPCPMLPENEMDGVNGKHFSFSGIIPVEFQCRKGLFFH